MGVIQGGLINRLLAKLGQTKIASEAARDVLVGHPLVTSIIFGDDSVSFTLKNGEAATVYESGSVYIKGNEWRSTDDANPYAGASCDIPF